MSGNKRRKSHIWDARKENNTCSISTSYLVMHYTWLHNLLITWIQSILVYWTECVCIHMRRLLSECWGTEERSTWRWSHSVVTIFSSDEAGLLQIVCALCLYPYEKVVIWVLRYRREKYLEVITQCCNNFFKWWGRTPSNSMCIMSWGRHLQRSNFGTLLRALSLFTPYSFEKSLAEESTSAQWRKCCTRLRRRSSPHLSWKL